MTYSQTTTNGTTTVTCTRCRHAERFVRGDELAIRTWKRTHTCTTPTQETTAA